jgi:RNA 2',3'-cyclic 3'-phosphodiesterase
LESADQHRLFVAIPVPEPVRREIEHEQAALKSLVPSRLARWSKPEQLHLTLRFLGNVVVSRIPELIAALEAVCDPLAPLKLQATGLGFFPAVRVPRVLWVGVRGSGEPLSGLWAAVQAATQEFTAEEPEKHFSGHITLARLSRLNRQEAEALAQTVRARQQKAYGEWTAREVELVHSRLSPQGARHELVAAIDLVGK